MFEPGGEESAVSVVIGIADEDAIGEFSSAWAALGVGSTGDDVVTGQAAIGAKMSDIQLCPIVRSSSICVRWGME